MPIPDYYKPKKNWAPVYHGLSDDVTFEIGYITHDDKQRLDFIEVERGLKQEQRAIEILQEQEWNQNKRHVTKILYVHQISQILGIKSFY